MADYGVSANRLELLQIADAVAREKSIDKSVVLHAMEEAIQKAAKARYGAENEIVAEIDPRSGETRLQRLLLVVEDVENEAIPSPNGTNAPSPARASPSPSPSSFNFLSCSCFSLIVCNWSLSKSPYMFDLFPPYQPKFL